ncbi:MAG: Fic family protein [Candidatus Methanoplasma sp.]|jgi:Fic family protein|nr:Fic family protein [Candidatus Methanoplasma sp.]
MSNGKPPYTITEGAADSLAKIVESVTRLELGTGFKRDIRLHRENRIRSIQSSLAIEGNSLSSGEVAAVIEGRIVAGRQEEVREAKNAYEAYDAMMSLDPYSVSDFLEAHRLMTKGLIGESGRFRSGDIGVFDGPVVIHIGARPQFVPGLVSDLFGWARGSDLHPVLKSAILHYEIETIHPFADGNGRMGRLWQTLVLAKWNPLFAWIPMESVIYQNRPQYYAAIEDARRANDSGAFIEFALASILETIRAQVEHQDKHQDKHQGGRGAEQITEAMLSALEAIERAPLSRKEIFAAIGMSGDSRAFGRIVGPLLSGGYAEMTVPDKPNSKLQRYRLTAAGAALIGKARSG